MRIEQELIVSKVSLVFSLSVLTPWLKEVSEVRELPNINELRKPVKQERGLVTPFTDKRV